MDARVAEDKDPNKERALTAALSQIERQFGKGAMMRLGDNPQRAYPLFQPGRWGWILPGNWWFAQRPDRRDLWA